MLKKGILLAVMSSALLFVSCTDKNETIVGRSAVPPVSAGEQLTTEPVQKTEQTIEQTSVQTPAVAQPAQTNQNQNHEVKPSGLTYTITSGTHTDQGVTITYPQIETADLNKKNHINDLIKREALKGLMYYQGAGAELSLDIKYEIKWQGSHLLSIHYSGVGNVKGAAHPNNLFYTTNINLVTGEKVRLQDIVKIDANFLETFKTGKWHPLRSEQKGLLDIYSKEQLTNMLVAADSLDTSDTYSYWTKDGLGISVSVGHAAGDHAEFEINSQDVVKSIDTSNEIWNDFVNR